ncbi:MAG: histidine kinase dimerization/phospho-acceptor domain-containing protein, partial [Planctomycetota bacterium]
MKRTRDPNILLAVAAIAAIVIAWAMGSVAVAAGAGLAAAAAWLAISLRNAGDASRIAGSLRRVLAGDRSAAMPLRVGATHAGVNAAVSDLATTLAGTRESLASERLRRRILEEALREGLVILDAQQRVLAANGIAGHMLGFDPAVARGRLLQECVRAPSINALLARAFAEGDRQQEDLEPPGMPGILTETVVACVRDEADRVAGALLLLSDVTAARSLDRMRSDFAANVSHELRTPITNIRGYVETLLQVGLEDRDTATRFLEIVHRNASRLGALVEDLLSLSFVENPGSRDRLEM